MTTYSFEGMPGHIVDALQDLAGDSLRVVAAIKSLDYEIKYIRADLKGKFSAGGFDTIYQNVVAEGLAGRDIGTVSGIGTPEAHVVFYEAVEVFLFPTGKYEGALVSLDRATGPPIADVIDTTTAAIAAAEE